MEQKRKIISYNENHHLYFPGTSHEGEDNLLKDTKNIFVISSSVAINKGNNHYLAFGI